jgi:4-diphosphocytidyl-2-C-methyl-D-erythritol kinase
MPSGPPRLDPVGAIVEIARAKINLTLCVLGRRPNGYHELESLVAFADVGDRVTLAPGAHRRVEVTGPFARSIVGENLLARTLDLLARLDPGLTLGTAHLEKNLPVAAGLGGGSADAAALLRAVRRANPERAGRIAWHELAARLGADVPVCLASVLAMMRGIGERIEPLPARSRLPALAAVLANPGMPLSTAAVFRTLAAGPISPDPEVSAAPDPFPDAASLVAFVRARGNDLEAPATALLPAIAEVKAALAAQPECSLAAMSGSGPTCFGIFPDDATAARAAARLAGQHPDWWVVATSLDDRAPATRLSSPG